MSRRYLYAIMQEASSPQLEDTKPVSGGEGGIEVIYADGLAVLSSDTSLDEVMATRRNMLTHTRVLEDAMTFGPILPFSFGTVVDNLGSIHDLIAGGKDAFIDDLQMLQGKMEIGLRASWDEQRIFSEIVEEDPDLRALALQVRTRPAAETYQTKIELGQRAEQLMIKKREAEGDALHALASQFALDVRKHTVSADMAVLDAAYLIQQSQETALMAALEAFDGEARGRLTLKIISPAPPYNFVSMNMAHDQLKAA
ncbi:MAG: GvpL/GvpF family gas vesicle protein [Pseudomonadota bacterium]